MIGVGSWGGIIETLGNDNVDVPDVMNGNRKSFQLFLF